MQINKKLIVSLLIFSFIAAKAHLEGSVSTVFTNYSSTTQALSKIDFQNLYSSEISASLQNKFQYHLDDLILGKTSYPSKIMLDENKDFKRKQFRISHWNIERGYKIDLLNKALNSTESFIKDDVFDEYKEEKHKEDKEYLLDEIHVLKNTDIFTLNEVDLGIQRTGYKNIAKEFADIVGASHYAFIPEFIEIDKVLVSDPTLDITKYKGLHGNAIVSKFPIKSARFVRLPSCYDWFENEKENLVLFEKARRKSSETIVQEEIITEVRRGNRVALIAEIDLPNTKEDLTVVSLHLENRCSPKCREQQLKAVLGELKKVEGPLVIGGDFNNFEKSAEPTTLIKVISRTLKDPQNLARYTITYFNPYSLMINPGLFVLNTYRKYKDPTQPGIPIILRNKAKKLFDILYDFEFKDKNRFDFSGNDELSYEKMDDRLSNSNQRGRKGFIETFHFHRSFGLAEFKVDWLFFKSLRVAGCDDKEDDFEDLEPKCKRFVPAFGRTLKEFNKSPKQEHFSDHNPISAIVLI